MWNESKLRQDRVTYYTCPNLKWGTTVALHYMHYNFCRIHKSLRVTPAMEAGVVDHVWSIEELAGLLDTVGKIAA